ncbi:MAG: hypothetical protein IT342_08665 [Candidatus Melainabacteria bacterium]|nr:hypothetical protein [Candidatus Melainabacteria bacterium]
MISRSVYRPVLAALLLLAGLCSNPFPALAAPTPTQLVEAIASSKVLPASVRVNAQYYMGQVSVYMYRSGRVPDNDLKIDSVLVTKVLRDKFGTDVKSVQLNFYDSNNQRDVRQCVVSQAQVDDFAARKMSQEQLLNYLTITRTTAGGGGSSGGGSYANAAKEQVLAAVCSPGYKEEDRGILLLQIKAIAKRDGNFQKLFAKFKQMDDMIKAGKSEEIVPVYNDLIPMITIEQANCNQRAAAAVNDAASRNNQAIVQSAFMSYFPRVGFAYHRRVAIWSAIKRMNAGGRDASAYVEYLQNRVDKPFIAGDLEGMKAGIIQLEQQLGIPVTFNWN